MKKENISKILIISGVVVLIIATILGIITLVESVAYSNTIIPKAETEFSVSGNGKVFEAQNLKQSHLDACLGLIPWGVSIMIAGVVILGVGLILQIKRKEIKVR